MPSIPLADRALSVMVLDSNDHSRRYVIAMLEALGIRGIREMANPEGALAAIEAEGPPDALIVDADLKPMDGMAFTRYLRTVVEGRAAYTPVILIAARATREAVLAARNAGVNEFMAKPVSTSGLSGRLLAVLDAPRPFVRTKDYFGPDRRRRQVDFSGDDRRGKG